MRKYSNRRPQKFKLRSCIVKTRFKSQHKKELLDKLSTIIIIISQLLTVNDFLLNKTTDRYLDVNDFKQKLMTIIKKIKYLDV